MVYMVAYAFQVRTYGLFVSKCFFFEVLFVIGYFAGFCHVAYQYFNSRYTVRDFFNKFFPIGTHYFVFFFREDFLHSAKVFQKTVLVADSDRDDVVDGQITQYAAFNLLSLIHI